MRNYFYKLEFKCKFNDITVKVYKLQLRLGPSHCGTNTSKITQRQLKSMGLENVEVMASYDALPGESTTTGAIQSFRKAQSSVIALTAFRNQPKDCYLIAYMLLRYKRGGYQEQSHYIQRKTNWRIFQIEALEKTKVPTSNNIVKLT